MPKLLELYYNGDDNTMTVVGLPQTAVRLTPYQLIALGRFMTSGCVGWGEDQNFRLLYDAAPFDKATQFDILTSDDIIKATSTDDEHKLWACHNGLYRLSPGLYTYLTTHNVVWMRLEV